MTGGSTTSPRIYASPRAEQANRALLLTLRLAFAALMLVTGTTKLLDFPGFVDIVATYRFLPDLLLGVAAGALTLIELALGVWLLVGRRLVLAAAAVVSLHLGYLVWLAIAFARGLEIENCGCFGVYWGRPLTAWTFLEDGVLLALALLLLVTARRAEA